MELSLLSYVGLGGLAIFGDSITYYAVSNSPGGYAGLGLIFVIVPTFVVNVIWGSSFPFVFNIFLDPTLPIVLRRSLLIASGIVHIIGSVGLNIFTFDMADKINKKKHKL